MFDLHAAPQPAPHVLREIIPVMPSSGTGISLIDEATAQWHEWNDEEEGLPDWSAFKPFEYPRWLSHVGVFKRVDGEYLCALIGEEVQSRLPHKLKGQFVHEAMPAMNAHDVIMRSDKALTDGLPNYVEKTMAWSPGRDFVRYRVLYLPFANARDRMSRILNVFDFEMG